MVKSIYNIKPYMAKNELVSNQDKISYVVEIVGEVSGAFSSAMSCLQTNSIPCFGLNMYLYPFICYVGNFTGQL
jgi:hypothetical protein